MTTTARALREQIAKALEALEREIRSNAEFGEAPKEYIDALEEIAYDVQARLDAAREDLARKNR